MEQWSPHHLIPLRTKQVFTHEQWSMCVDSLWRDGEDGRWHVKASEAEQFHWPRPHAKKPPDWENGGLNTKILSSGRDSSADRLCLWPREHLFVFFQHCAPKTAKGTPPEPSAGTFQKQTDRGSLNERQILKKTVKKKRNVISNLKPKLLHIKHVANAGYCVCVLDAGQNGCRKCKGIKVSERLPCMHARKCCAA